MGRPGHPVLVGQSLWIQDDAADPFLHLLSAVDGRLTRSLGRPGKGPGDFGGITDLSARPGDTQAIWAYDFYLRRLTRFPSAESTGQPLQVITLSHVARTPMRASWLTRDRVLGYAARDSGVFTLYDDTGSVVSRVPWPLPGPDSIPYEGRLVVGVGSEVCARRDGAGFFVAYAFLGRIDAFDEHALFQRRVDVPFASEPLFRAVPGGRIIDGSTRLWYNSCATSQEFLYAGFDGRAYPLPPAPPTFEKWCSPFIHVFDLRGRLVRVLLLDRPVRGITVDSANTWLYGACVDNATIYRFRLPPSAAGP